MAQRGHQDLEGQGSPVPKISSLIGLLEAYARLTIYHAETNELLCDAITRRESELVPALVVKVTSRESSRDMTGIKQWPSQVARACAALSFAHPGVLRPKPKSLATE